MEKQHKERKLIIFTAFNSSLFNELNKEYQAAISIIGQLQNREIPLIAVSEQAHAELEDLRQVLEIKSPLIVEYGSAILISKHGNLWQNKIEKEEFTLTETNLDEQYYVKQLGCTYIEARAVLKVIQSTVRINNLRGFGDLSEREIQSLTGLSKKQIKQIKNRSFSEIFITPKNVDTQEITDTAEEFGFKALIKDNLSCLIGAEASIAKAINWVKNKYQLLKANKEIITVGLGFSDRDLELLDNVEIPFVINGMGIDSILAQKYPITTKNGLAGWVEAIEKICE